MAVLGACTASREVPPSSKVVEWKAVTVSEAPEAGGSQVEVLLSATVESGWKMYSLTQGEGGPVAMTVRVPEGAAYSVSSIVSGPAPTKAMDPNFGIESETYAGSPAFRLTLQVPSDATGPLELRVRSQACSDKLCLPARTVTVPVERLT
jgi:thiol:disulfide interchange protein DsbD